MLEDFPEIEHAARVFGGRTLLGRGETSFYEDRFRWADASLFDIFDFEWIAGDPPTALEGPASLVLTESLATKYFGAEDPIGETLMANNMLPMNVTGVIRDLPDNTHLSIDAIASLESLVGVMGPAMLANWNGSTDFHTYFLLSEGASIDTVESDFESLYRGEERQGTVFAAFSLLAVFIACLGLLGLTSFTIERRTKEIGVRKVMGGSVADIVTLFTAELGKLVLLANVIAWPAIYFLMQSWLSNFAYRIDMSLWAYVGSALLALLIAGLTIGFVAARAATAKPMQALRYE